MLVMGSGSELGRMDHAIESLGKSDHEFLAGGQWVAHVVQNAVRHFVPESLCSLMGGISAACHVALLGYRDVLFAVLDMPAYGACAHFFRPMDQIGGFANADGFGDRHFHG